MKTIYLFDIDGCAADVTGLLHLIAPPTEANNHTPNDFEAYYNRIGEAQPITAGVALYQMLVNTQAPTNIDVWYLTGRDESCYEATAEWLCKNGLWPPHVRLLMRPTGDHSPAYKVKDRMVEQVKARTPEWLDCQVVAVDDDPAVCEMYLHHHPDMYVMQPRHRAARSS